MASHKDHQQVQQQAQQQDYGRHFDPYSVYDVGDDEEDVWYSEERLFEDHLDEIFNKWPQLDDDIWCKLIIMERNRRIGKAYARVPMVTIDGSHELSYDGCKLALNGFDNPDRDPMTQKCRKRIGEGIRIKMDDFGNIQIRRLSRSAIFVKECLGQQQQQQLDHEQYGAGALQRPAHGAGGNSSSAERRPMMPSRQQVIKNQLAAMTDEQVGHSQPARPDQSLEQHDSAICDEVISLGGRLDPGKIYIMFDMRKFQANISQELRRPFPDKRRLERQCFSIVGFACDSDDILSLPCWVMVINIVAIEMLNQRFPPTNSSFHPNSLLASDHRGRPAPSFVSIFDAGQQQQQAGRHQRQTDEEDPYSLPANASSSDLKSSIHDSLYASGTAPSQTSSQNASQQRNSRRGDLHRRKAALEMTGSDDATNKLMLGPRTKPIPLTGASGRQHQGSSSIYSPGHMLVPRGKTMTQQAVGDRLLPPKLPPRDFVCKPKLPDAKEPAGSRQATDERPATGQDSGQTGGENQKKRRSKKSRFLESCKAPLEFAESLGFRSSAQKGGSNQQGAFLEYDLNAEAGHKSEKGKQAKGNATSDESSNPYVKLIDSDPLGKRRGQTTTSAEADSVVDSSEELEAGNLAAAGYQDLDIPTPDYEVDENIYAASHSAQGYSQLKEGAKQPKGKGSERKSLARKQEEDLYYSGFKAHVPQTMSQEANEKFRGSSRFMMHQSNKSRFAASRLPSKPAATRKTIYGSSAELMANGQQQQQAKLQLQQQRFRSASMQRCGSSRALLLDGPSARSQLELYQLEPESHYAIGGVASGQRHRAGGRLAANGQAAALRMSASIANSNYDVGRSSSGIYGNNSSSSSSDYADWYPQMRKLNSSGYLNSVFKSQLTGQQQQQRRSNITIGSPLHQTSNLDDVCCGNQPNGQCCPADDTSPANNKSRTRTSNQARALKTNHQRGQHLPCHLEPSGYMINGPIYRSYESSSNDSEPSYANSSDGLDIYDQIGARSSRADPHGNQQRSDRQANVKRHYQTDRRRLADEFLDQRPEGKMAPEIHVGKWENLYD